ncbi:MAG TPA: hypothetical protein VM487_00570 [Phycisphaerae bacterium]|nr:hypothetical protein [Phycisphaerae bacterium]
MRIGPENWGWVSIDEAGVPQGGRWGNARQFAEKAAKQDMFLAWSRPWECFDLYTRLGNGQIIHQFRFLNPGTGRPIPLCLELLDLMVYLRNRPSGGTLADKLDKFNAEMRYEAVCERQRQLEAMRAQVMDKVSLDMGRTPKVTIEVPDMVGVK